MRPLSHLVRGVAISATLALALRGVAHAGMNDRAQAAIAEARGKISASTMVGAGEEVIGLQTRAKTALNEAEALLSKGKKEQAVAAAQQASLLADQALAMSQSRKETAANTAVVNAEAAAASAQQSAAAANQQAAAANARADMAVAMATPSERTFWVRVIEKGQQQDGDLAEALAIMHRHGAMEAARADAVAWAARARAALTVLPDHALRDVLGDLADYVVSRLT